MKLTHKEKTLKVLVKRGNNEERAIELMNRNYLDALKIRPEGTPAKIADIVICL